MQNILICIAVIMAVFFIGIISGYIILAYKSELAGFFSYFDRLLLLSPFLAF